MRFAIIHPNGSGTADSNWQPWLKKQLQDMGHEVICPTMPDSKNARSSIWLPYMHDTMKIDRDTVIVGHSSGAVAAMRYAEQYRIKASILIGVCYTDLDDEDEKISGYYDDMWDWQKIRSNQDFVVVMAGSDDPWVPIDEARHVYSSLQAEYHEYPDKGHFFTEHMGGKTNFPELLQIIKNHIGNEDH